MASQAVRVRFAVPPGDNTRCTQESFRAQPQRRQLLRQVNGSTPGSKEKEEDHITAEEAGKHIHADLAQSYQY